jgi:hypothetical protein
MSPEENKEKKRLAIKKWRENNSERNKTNSKAWYEKNKEKELERSKKWRENNPEKVKENSINWNENNPEYGKKYRAKNKEKEIERVNIWRENNPEKVNESQRNYRKTIPHIVAWRNLLRGTFIRLNKKKEGHTIDLLGYSALEFKIHIESLFTEGMSWDNHGEWHIDHIKTVISFDKDTLPNIVNALPNLRPLWSTTRELNGVIYEGNLNRPKY